MIITKHAQKRLTQRLGLNKKSQISHAEKAFKEGVFPENYPDRKIGMSWNLAQEKNKDFLYSFYNDNIYIWGLSHLKTPMLITLFSPYQSHKGKHKYYYHGKLHVLN